ncbi:MAG: ATP-binding protein [Burkholderiales bacterium]|nr:ATP-binding protein [Burkholderiales bacterium]
MTSGPDNADLLAQVAELQAQVELLNATCSQMPQGALVLGQDGRVKYFNAQACEIASMPTEFMASRPLLSEIVEIQHQRGEFGTDFSLVQPSARAYVASRGVTVDHTIPTRYTRKTRDGRYIEVTSSPMLSGDYVRTYTDVTAYEKAKLQAEQLAQQKGQFMALLSHELRTPLTTILGMNALLLDSKLDAEQHDYAQRVSGAGSLMLSVLNDVLDFSKAEAGKLRIELERFQLAPLLREVAQLMFVEAQHKGLALELALDPALPQWLQGDPLRLKQVLLNLVGNAVKFTAQGRVRLSATLSQQQATRVWVQFEVADTGVGIAPEYQAGIFNQFEQLGEMSRPSVGGSGLGLAICKTLLGLMGGWLSVTSALGEGSQFWFGLPFDQTEDQPAQPPAAARTQGRPPLTEPPQRLAGLRVLAVDDNPNNRLLVRLMLKREGCQVTLCEDAQSALASLQQSPDGFDAVLMDVQMPGTDGLMATRAIRQTLGLSTLPIIGMTAGIFPEDQQACFDAGMNRYVGKPFNLEALVLALQDTRPLGPDAASA